MELLERLSIKEIFINTVKLTELIRLEADFYTSDSIKFKKSVTGEKIIDLVQYGTSEELNEESLGYPVLRLNEFESNFIKSPDKYCNKISEEVYQSLKLYKNDVLICRTNGNPKLVGKSAIVQKDFEYAYASYLFKIRPKKELINSATLVTFLNSKYGRLEIEKYSMVGNQANFSPAKFKEISIPIFENKFNLIIDDLTFQSSELLLKSQELYSQAETLLLQEIGFDESLLPSKQEITGSNPDWITTSMIAKTGIEPNINVKSFKESFGVTGRLDAEYYQKKYEQYEELVTKNKKGYSYIKNEFEHIKAISKKDKLGYNYIEIGDVNVGDGLCTFNYVLSEDLPANAKTIVKKGDILISNVRPYRGAVTIIDFEIDDLIVSGAFTVLREKENSIFSNEVLKVLLRTKTYKDWLLKFNVGTSYPVIKDDDVLNLPIPFISEDTQKNITKKIQESQNLKKQSEQLLEIAKKAVEIAIEENEEVAMAFIKANTK